MKKYNPYTCLTSRQIYEIAASLMRLINKSLLYRFDLPQYFKFTRPPPIN